MPLYDYKCAACGTVREHRQSISDEPLRVCPDCGGEYKRIITSVGVIFKGSGFHINDYRSSASGTAKDDASKSTADSSSEKSSSSADGGAATKAEKPSESTPSSKEGSQGDKVA